MSELLKNAHAALFSIIHPLFSDFLRICCFILSHPLYLSYFVFFLPYFLKVLFFLSPLVITVSLLLLALLALSSAPHNGVLGRFLGGRTNEDVSSSVVVGDGYGNSSVELEAYKIVFEIFSPEVLRIKQEEDVEVIKGIVAEQVVILGKDQSFGDDHSTIVPDQAVSKMGSDGIFIKCSSVIYEDSSDVAFRENDSDEIGNQQPEVIKHITEEKMTKVHLKKQEEEEANFSKNSSLQRTNEDEGKQSENFAQNCLDDQKNNNCNNLGSYGSMRKEKEWKRTLACKLFEERHNGGSVEDMDLLWETYETADDHEKVKESPLSKSKMKKKMQNEKTRNRSKKGSILDQWLEEEEEEEEETDSSKLCCLQALKLSSAKMNLGLGKPNLVKMSKALKRIGWLHHVTAKNVTKTHKKYY